jgi:hypothetical protein
MFQWINFCTQSRSAGSAVTVNINGSGVSVVSGVRRTAPPPPAATAPPKPQEKATVPPAGENLTSEPESQCTICMERKRDMAFLCGHTACRQCAQSLNICHMCRAPITQKIQLYD